LFAGCGAHDRDAAGTSVASHALAPRRRPPPGRGDRRCEGGMLAAAEMRTGRRRRRWWRRWTSRRRRSSGDGRRDRIVDDAPGRDLGGAEGGQDGTRPRPAPVWPRPRLRAVAVSRSAATSVALHCFGFADEARATTHTGLRQRQLDSFCGLLIAGESGGEEANLLVSGHRPQRAGAPVRRYSIRGLLLSLGRWVKSTGL